MSAMSYMAVTLSARQQRVTECARREHHGNATETLLALLYTSGPMTTRDLSDALGLAHTKLVWGLLKAHRESGRVRYTPAVRLWELDRDFISADVAKAIELLRANGYRVDRMS